MAKKYIVCHRRGTAVQWAEADIIPKSGELVIEIDETNNLHKLKIGDGVHRYSELAYLMAGDEIVTQVLTQLGALAFKDIVEQSDIDPSVQADYNQTDETKVDYIKNKPQLGALAFKDIVEQSDIDPSVHIVNILPYVMENRLINDSSGAYLELNTQTGSYIVGAQSGKTVNQLTTIWYLEIDKANLPIALSSTSKLKIIISNVTSDIKFIGDLQIDENTHVMIHSYSPIISGSFKYEYEIDLSLYEKIRLGFSIEQGVTAQFAGTIQILTEVNHQTICKNINQNLDLISINTSSIAELKDELRLSNSEYSSLIKQKICRIDDISNDKKIRVEILNQNTCTIRVSGKNLANMGYKYYPNRREVSNGITWQVMQDGSFEISGTATADEFAMSEPIYLAAGTYAFSGFTSITGATEKSALKIYTYDVEDDVVGDVIGTLTDWSETIFTLNSDTTVVVQIEWEQGVNYDGVIIKPQIELGVTSTSYESWRKNYTITTSDFSVYVDGYYPTTTLTVINGDSLIHWVMYSRNFQSLLIDKIYPVGSIYLSMYSADPSHFFGFGTWRLIGINRMLIGAGDKYEAGATGGSETVTLTSTQVPKVSGTISLHNGAVATNIEGFEGECFSSNLKNEGVYMNQGTKQSASSTQSYGRINFDNGGTGASHNNMPPYFAVYMWQRTI